MRVLTWNLWWRFGDWAARQEAILAVLRETDADVVTLQEVWATPSENLAELIARELGMQWAWSPSPAPGRWQQRLGEPDVDIGNAVLSRWPIIRQAREVLPRGSAEKAERTVLHALVETPHGTLPVFTTHLESSPSASAARCEQVAAVARCVATHAGDRPPVLAGDFNAEPDSDEMRLLGGHLTAPAVPGLVLVDAWRWAADGDPGWTWDRRHPFIHASPSARIDYVLLGPGQDVADVRVVGNAPVDGVWPSDHAAVLAELAD